MVREAATITEKQEDEIALLTNKVAHLEISNNELTREVTQLSSTVDYLEQDIIEKDNELEEAQEHLSDALSAQIDSCYKAEQYKILAQSFKLRWNSCRKKLENDNSNLPNDPIVAIVDHLSHDCADPGTFVARLCQGILTDENLIPFRELFLECFCPVIHTEIHEKSFAAYRILLALDLGGGTCSYEGYELLRKVETRGVKYK